MSTITPNDTRNFMVYLEGVFIGLLNQYIDITITKPTKKSIVTQQYLKIDSVTIENEIINVAELVDKRCKDILERDKTSGIKEGSAVRRFTLNKTTEIHHFLMDLLQLFGYYYNSKMVAGKNGAMKVEIAESIYFHGKKIFSKNQICEIGEKVNHLLCEMVMKEKSIELKKNDPLFKELFDYDNYL